MQFGLFSNGQRRNKIARTTYLEDLANYGLPDYWATPLQFLDRDGDCEDYAIAKFVSLRELGFAADELTGLLGSVLEREGIALEWDLGLPDGN